MTKAEKNRNTAQLFLKHFNDNYKQTTYEISRILGKLKLKYNDDHFHEALIKSYNHIEKNGFKFTKGIKLSGYSFMGYMIRAVRNEIMNTGIKEKKIDRNINVDDKQTTHLLKDGENFGHNRIPQSLIYDQQEHLEIIEHHILEDQTITDIFIYVENKYPPLETGMFKFYFKTNLSFAKIADISGYSLGFIFNAVTKIKNDVKSEFKLSRLK
jgi:hypothetical protein